MNNIFDESKGLAATGGDRELLRELIALFEEESAKQLVSLGEAIDNRDSAQIRLTAHTIKGSLGALGSVAALKTAGKIERLASEEPIRNAAGLYAKLGKELSEFIRKATHHFNEAKV